MRGTKTAKHRTAPGRILHRRAGKMLPRIGGAGRSYAELIIGEINYGIDFESERFV